MPGIYTWNELNQVTSYTNNKGEKYEYRYNHQGLRTCKKTPTKETKYYYNTGGKVISEIHSDGTQVQVIWSNKPLVRIVNGKHYYYIYNGHGDVVQVIDENGLVVNRYDYDEWGKTVHQEEGIENPIRYTGEYYDSESGNYYLRARYYSPAVQRFISRDPYEGEITNPLSLNGYAYCGGNPLIYRDPSGNVCEKLEDGIKLTYVDKFEIVWEDGLDGVVDILLGFTPVDIIIDGISFVAGYNIITKEQQDRLLSLGYIILPGAMEIGGKSVKVAKSIDLDSMEGIAKGVSNAERLSQGSVVDKLDRYLLNKEHPVGGSKAEWFDKALGFNKDNLNDLAKQIVFDESKAVQTGVTEFGTKYNQVINVTGANGKNIDVLFSWIRNNDGIVRLVTGIPTKK